MSWIELETKISDIEALMLDGYEIQVDSPDGYVPVSLFVDKGMWDEYVLTTIDGKTVQCNENHLFETDRGWVYAKDCIGKSIKVLTRLGFVDGNITKSKYQIPIVDIQVEHTNHRYYTNDVSSHNTGVGKSLFMCHHAANCLAQSKDVLYITCEMAEERIAERIDANLMDISIDELKKLSQDIYTKRLQKATMGITGKLLIKEYPTASANANHFRHLLDELRLKKKFKPNIIFIDYLNICASTRFKPGANVNSYTYIKAIAEELRGLAVEMGVPIFTATQTNRSGFGNTDVELTDTSESFGLPATADFMFALVATEQLDQLGQVMVKQLKNRYNDVSTNRKFVLGIDRSKMKLFDVDESQQQLVQGNLSADDDKEEEEPFNSPRAGGRGRKGAGGKSSFGEWS